MTISIDDINRSRVNSSGKSTSANNDSGRTDSNKPASTTNDTVVLTDSAKQIQQLEKQLESIPVVDAHRVADVRENLISGNYTISNERVAEKLIRYETSLQQAS